MTDFFKTIEGTVSSLDGEALDAAVTDDATLLLTDVEGRTEQFDSLDAAARHLGFTNVDGLDFWVLDERPDQSLSALLNQRLREPRRYSSLTNLIEKWCVPSEPRRTSAPKDGDQGPGQLVGSSTGD